MPDDIQPGQEDAGSKIWRYDGTWTKVPEPYDWDGDGDYSHALGVAGFSRFACGFGMPNAPSVEIYEHEKDERWLVNWMLSDRVHTIEVAGLPSLIDLLSRLAPTATAIMLTEAAEHDHPTTP